MRSTTRSAPAATALEPLTVSVDEAARLIGMGRTKLWQLIWDGKFPRLQEGRWVRVPVEGMRDWVRRNTT